MKKFLRITPAMLIISMVSLTGMVQAGNNIQTRDFVLNYGAGVQNIQITFDQAHSNRGNTNNLTVKSSVTTKNTTISVNSELDKSSSIATSFNSIYPYNWQTLQMNSNNAAPEKLDFWVEGKMTINGQPVISANNEYGFSWAHDSKTGNWWIANNEFVNRNLENSGLTVATYDGKQSISYCMNADKNSSFSVTVNKGACSQRSLDFVFNYNGINVTSVVFKNSYNPAISSGILSYESITDQSSTYKTILTFTSQLNNSSSLANQFNSAYAADHSVNLNGATTDKATALDFWAEGDLYINNSRVIQTSGATNAGFSFVHEYSTKNWWIADNNATAYINPENFYLLDLTTEDGNFYCLSGDKGSNYSVTVTYGKCTVPGLASYELTMERGNKSITSLKYIPSPTNPDPNNLPNFESVTVSNPDQITVIVTVTSVENNSTNLANDFSTKFDQDKRKMMELTDGNNKQPKKLNFWLSGQLQVTYLLYLCPGTATYVTNLDLAQEDSKKSNEWWVASADGYKNKQFDGYWEFNFYWINHYDIYDFISIRQKSKNKFEVVAKYQ